jgi:hypothetical protein
MTDADLEALLTETLSSDVPHVTKVTVSAALVAEVPRRRSFLILESGSTVALWGSTTPDPQKAGIQ